MFLRIHFLVITSFCLAALSAYGSDSTSVKRDSTQVFFFYHTFEQFGLLDVHANDTSLHGFQNYDPLFRRDRFFATLGNLGQSSASLLPWPASRESGFEYGMHAYDGYLFRNDSVKYYKVSKTFTELLYTQGPKKEQQFGAVFSRNIYKSLNIGFNFRVMDSPGAYTRQRANQINFVVTAQFFTKNKRYGVIANFLYNRIRNYENGGIKYDSIFEQNIETNRKVIPVWLDQATNRVKESSFYMKHYFDLTRHIKPKSDTSGSWQPGVELGRITYAFQYSRQIFNYLDDNLNTGFYHNFYLDSLATADSITTKKLTNEITWSNPSFTRDKRYRLLQLEAGLKLQYIEISDHDLRHFLIQYIPRASVYFHPIRSLLLKGNADIVFGDYNEGDFSVDVSLRQTLGSAKRNIGAITLTGYYSLQQPDWFYSTFSGNNFTWDNDWNKQSFISGGAMYDWREIQAGFRMSRIGQYIYLDTAAIPQQSGEEFGLLQVWLNGNQDIGRFRLEGKLIFQSVQGSTLLRLPEFMGSLNLYYTQPLFRGAALLQPGLSFFYNTRYQANAYMPATRSFYLQDITSIGNYCYMDFFINIKIQRARFFLMYSNFSAWFMGRDYFTVPHYPMQDAAFRFGITWRFHD